MELHDFVSATLVQLITGIKEAQSHEAIREAGAAICPIGQSTNDTRLLNQSVNFDVAVFAEDSKGTKGRIGVFVAPFGLSSEGKSHSSKSSQNRIQFTVPVYLPGQKIPR